MGLLLVVSGLPGSGKTTIATRLVRSSNLVLLSKDEIKEQLFDAIGIDDREWSKRIGRASIELLFRFARRVLEAQASAVIESTFRPEDSERFHRLQREFDCKLLQIHCTCAAEELKRRFRRRTASGQRHPGHVDDRNIAEFESQFDNPDRTLLALRCPAIEIDTTDPSQTDFDALSTAVGSAPITSSSSACPVV